MVGNEKFKILVADEDSKNRSRLVRSLRHRGYEVESARDGEAFLNMVGSASPMFDWSVMDAGLTYNGRNWVDILFRLSRTDIDLPVMMVGPESAQIATETISHSDRVPVYVSKARSDYVSAVRQFIEQNLVMSADVGKVSMIKVGGSTFDFLDDNRRATNLVRFANACRSPSRPGGGLILSVGGGRFKDLQNAWFEQHRKHSGRVKENNPTRRRDTLEHNVRNLVDLFDGAAKYIPSREFVKVTEDFLRDYVAVMPMAPFPIHRKHGIGQDESDVQTIATAVFYGIEELIFLKRTDGVYLRDPYFGSEGKQMDWRYAQKGNRRLRHVTAKDLLGDKISRVDERGEGGHLIEDNAITYWLERAPQLKAIYVIHIAPEEMFISDPSTFVHGPLQHTHLIDPSLRYSPMENQLYAALRGTGYKITRERQS